MEFSIKFFETSANKTSTTNTTTIISNIGSAAVRQCGSGYIGCAHADLPVTGTGELG